MRIFGPGDGLVFCHQPTRKRGVAVLALVDEPLLQASGQRLSAATLRLRQAMSGLPQFVRMRNLFTRGERQQMREARINADLPIRHRRNVL